MTQDMSAQGPAGLSKPAFGAKAPVQDHGGFGVAGEQSGSNSIDAGYAANPRSAFPAQDKSNQGPAGTTDKMVNTIESTRAFGAGN
jgi:hypothetical protein